MGYPLLVKAVMGGGGKGMKLAEAPHQFLVRTPVAAGWLAAACCCRLPCCPAACGTASLRHEGLLCMASPELVPAPAPRPQDALHSAKREALAGFGDDRVLLERFITRPRHVEASVCSLA